jgi:hypothetical protein
MCVLGILLWLAVITDRRCQSLPRTEPLLAVYEPLSSPHAHAGECAARSR